MRNHRILLIKSFLIFVTGFIAVMPHLHAQPDTENYAETIYVNGRDVQKVIDQAPAYSTIVGDDRERMIRNGETIVIDKPLRLTNFRGRLAPGTRDTRILQVDAKHVMIDNFRLYGNYGTVSLGDRRSLLRVRAGHFLIENGQVFDSMKHGIVVRSMDGDTEHGIIRNIVSHNIRRDAISLTGYGDLGFFNRNILIENITAYRSKDRGAVEISDGNENITIRNVYADSCRYGVEIQDHGREGQVNIGIVIEGVDVANTMSAVNFNLSDYGHGNITLRDISGESWPPRSDDRFQDRSPIDIRNVRNVIVENIHISKNNSQPVISIQDSEGLMIRNVFIENQGDTENASIRAVDVSDLLIDGVNVRADGNLGAVVSYQLSGRGDHRNVQIRGISATKDLPVGILLERLPGDATLTNYTITGNLVRIVDRINGSAAYVDGNLE